MAVFINIVADGKDAAPPEGQTGFEYQNPAAQGAHGEDANCGFFGDDCAGRGGTGGDGASGGRGGSGGPGGHAPIVIIEVNSFDVIVALSAKGGKGGNGGRGGQGQRGGKGGEGGAGEDCEYGLENLPTVEENCDGGKQ